MILGPTLVVVNSVFFRKLHDCEIVFLYLWGGGGTGVEAEGRSESVPSAPAYGTVINQLLNRKTIYLIRILVIFSTLFFTEKESYHFMSFKF